jgi:hypothetical protein
MADRLLFISWGETVRGREERALEVFNETVGMYGRMQQEGRIERFDVRLLMPNAQLDGYFEVEGTAEQLAALKEDAEFRRSMTDATLIVDRITVTDGFCGQGIADQMALFTEAIGRVPQHT